jgi:hypothetical protein
MGCFMAGWHLFQHGNSLQSNGKTVGGPVENLMGFGAARTRPQASEQFTGTLQHPWPQTHGIAPSTILFPESEVTRKMNIKGIAYENSVLHSLCKSRSLKADGYAFKRMDL